MPIVQLKEIVMGNTAAWCQLPYGRNKKGCPNYHKSGKCPPFAPSATSLITIPYYLVYLKFDLEAQEKRMKEKHLEWTTGQARNCRYWQNTVQMQLMDEAKKLALKLLLQEGIPTWILEKPEANGVDLFKTCEQAGIHLERDYRHQKYVYKMVIVGRRQRITIPKIR